MEPIRPGERLDNREFAGTKYAKDYPVPARPGEHRDNRDPDDQRGEVGEGDAGGLAMGVRGQR